MVFFFLFLKHPVDRIGLQHFQDNDGRKVIIRPSNQPKLSKEPFNNYLGKMRGSKFFVFVDVQGIKTVHARGQGSKMAKFCPRSC